jgi:hypothetical protein
MSLGFADQFALLFLDCKVPSCDTPKLARGRGHFYEWGQLPARRRRGRGRDADPLARNAAARTEAGNTEQIKCHLDRLAYTIELFNGKSPQPETQAHLLKFLATGLGLAERRLTARPPRVAPTLWAGSEPSRPTGLAWLPNQPVERKGGSHLRTRAVPRG